MRFGLNRKINLWYFLIALIALIMQGWKVVMLVDLMTSCFIKQLPGYFILPVNYELKKASLSYPVLCISRVGGQEEYKDLRHILLSHSMCLIRLQHGYIHLSLFFKTIPAVSQILSQHSNAKKYFGIYSNSRCVGHFNESLSQQHWPQLWLTSGGRKEKIIFFIKWHRIIYCYFPPASLKRRKTH